MILRSQRGISLIEALICMSMLGFATCAYMLFTALSSTNSKHAVKVSVASTIIESVAGELSMVPANTTLLMSASELPVGAPYPFTRFYNREGVQVPTAATAYYTVSWTATPNQPIAGARAIALNVNWNEGGSPRGLRMRVVR